MIEVILDILTIVWAIIGIFAGGVAIVAILLVCGIVIRYVAEWCWVRLMG